MGENILGIGNMGAGGSFGSGGGGFRISSNRWKKHSDQSIEENVHRRLADHPEVSLTSVHAQVKDGVVVLSGTVLSQKISDFLEDEVEVLPGVQEVKNELQT
ncbi:MAG: hypothetical protein COT73_06685 [Bdellovibrio sp. CG10_big_fil_rev_8_21_14_0_10_47_8]|nr:MAG: hypothetical protein COT73_06685 [Bdellovibrio sp. CG10_big_fil_rev_8_21_14_0_10_47_8]